MFGFTISRFPEYGEIVKKIQFSRPRLQSATAFLSAVVLVPVITRRDLRVETSTRREDYR